MKIAQPKYFRYFFILPLVLAALVGWRYWNKHLRYEYFPRNFGAIEEGILYRSGRIHPKLLPKVLRDHEIKYIANLINTYPPEDAIAERMGIRVFRMETLKGDGTGDINDYARAITVMVKGKQKGHPVLVHCAAGTQRAGGVTATYRILVEGVRDNDAIIAELKKYGWRDRDVVLLNFINKNMYALAQNLVERNIIQKIPEPMPQIHYKGATVYQFDKDGIPQSSASNIE
jgi:protein-tyrosine phosphatase